MDPQSNSLPDQGSSTGLDSRAGMLSFLNPDWINERLMHVADRVAEMVERIMGSGLMATGTPPMEVPVTPDLISHMSPEQLSMFMDSLPTIGEKAQVLAIIKQLGVPPGIAFQKASAGAQTAQLRYEVPGPTSEGLG